MLTKLAFKNVGKSFRDYAVYFFTLVLGVCVFYMFNSIYAQQEIMTVTETTNQSMVALREILSYISVFVAVVLGFLIVYANNFFIKRRKKELGIYMTLGMSKRKISTILVLETSLMAIVALICGLLLGVFGSQFMSIFTAKLFEADMMAYKFIFPPNAALKSILYFGVIFLVVVVFNTISIGKFKLIDLIYGGRKNETLKIKNIWLSVIIFVVSLLCLGMAYFLILWNGMININGYFLLSIILGTVGTILFFLSVAGFLTKLMQSNKKLYFKNLNMFVTRQLGSKINTNFVSVSVVCIVLLFVIGIFSCGYSMQTILSEELKSNIKYDFSLLNHSNEEDREVEPIYDNLPKKIQNRKEIKSHYEYKKYSMTSGKNYYEDYDVDLSSIPVAHNLLNFISLSDYNELMELQGLDKIFLSENQYTVLCDNEQMKSIANQFAEKNLPITVNHTKLTSNGSLETASINNFSFGNIIFIVNDKFTKSMSARESVLNIVCGDDLDCEAFDKILKQYQKSVNYENLPFVHYGSRVAMYASSISTKALISFLAIYLGIVFMITCAAILAIQQLSDAADNKERYDLLKKLGTEKSMLNRALFIQILCYFLLPLLVAVVHSIVGLTAANDVIRIFGRVDIAGSIVATGVFVVVVYGAYFGLTYIGSKNIINKG